MNQTVKPLLKVVVFTAVVTVLLFQTSHVSAKMTNGKFRAGGSFMTFKPIRITPILDTCEWRKKMLGERIKQNLRDERAILDASRELYESFLDCYRERSTVAHELRACEEAQVPPSQDDPAEPPANPPPGSSQDPAAGSASPAEPEEICYDEFVVPTMGLTVQHPCDETCPDALQRLQRTIEYQQYYNDHFVENTERALEQCRADLADLRAQREACQDPPPPPPASPNPITAPVTPPLPTPGNSTPLSN